MQRPMLEKGGIFMTCTEAYKEHIEYTFNAFCRAVIRYGLLTHGVTGTSGDKGKSPLSISQKKSFIHSVC